MHWNLSLSVCFSLGAQVEIGIFRRKHFFLISFRLSLFIATKLLAKFL